MKTVAWARTSKSLAEEAPSVAEGSGDVLLSKKKKKHITLSIAEIPFQPERAFPSLGET